jgi:hypothetical protein
LPTISETEQRVFAHKNAKLLRHQYKLAVRVIA